MFVYLVGSSTLASFIKLILTCICFVLILVAAYCFTKWYAGSGMVKNKTKNIQVMESYPLGPGKQICILKIGEKYVAVAIAKDQVTVLTELQEEQLTFEEIAVKNTSFGEVFGNTMKEQWSQKRKKNDRKG